MACMGAQHPVWGYNATTWSSVCVFTPYPRFITKQAGPWICTATPLEMMSTAACLSTSLTYLQQRRHHRHMTCVVLRVHVHLVNKQLGITVFDGLHQLPLLLFCSLQSCLRGHLPGLHLRMRDQPSNHNRHARRLAQYGMPFDSHAWDSWQMPGNGLLVGSCCMLGCCQV